MNDFLAIFHQNPLAVLFGVMGLMCQLLWPLFGARRTILTVQFGVGANYSVQYALLDAWSGAGIASLGATQTAIAFFAGDRPWLRKLGLIFLPAIGGVCYATWSGSASFFALAACSLVMLGRMQNDTLRLRMFLLAAAPFGISYDVTVGAPVAVVGAISSASIATVMLIREVRSRRRLVEAAA
jgi:hypothetical protein